MVLVKTLGMCHCCRRHNHLQGCGFPLSRTTPVCSWSFSLNLRTQLALITCKAESINEEQTMRDLLHCSYGGASARWLYLERNTPHRHLSKHPHAEPLTSCPSRALTVGLEVQRRAITCRDAHLRMLRLRWQPVQPLPACTVQHPLNLA